MASFVDRELEAGSTFVRMSGPPAEITASGPGNGRLVTFRLRGCIAIGVTGIAGGEWRAALIHQPGSEAHFGPGRLRAFVERMRGHAWLGSVRAAVIVPGRRSNDDAVLSPID